MEMQGTFTNKKASFLNCWREVVLNNVYIEEKVVGIYGSVEDYSLIENIKLLIYINTLRKGAVTQLADILLINKWHYFVFQSRQ